MHTMHTTHTMTEKTAKMMVTILGSGTCVPSLTRSSCSVLVETGESKILLDSGAGTIHRLLEAGVTIFDITHIFYSHFHPDHMSELVQFLFANKYAGGPGRKIPLVITAGEGFKRFYQGLKQVFEWIEWEPGMLDIIELDVTGPDSAGFRDFSVKSMPMRHNPESLGYRITDLSECAMVYSGDTDYHEPLITLARHANLLICESSFPDELKTRGHMTPGLAGKIAEAAGAEKLVLTHFYPECDGVDIEKQCKNAYSGALILAEDLMKIEVT